MGSGGEGPSAEDESPSYLVSDPYEMKPCTMTAPDSKLRFSITGKLEKSVGFLEYGNDALKASARCVNSIRVVAGVAGHVKSGWEKRLRLLEECAPDEELSEAWQENLEVNLLTPVAALARSSGALFLKLGQLSAQMLSMAPESTRGILDACRDNALTVPVDSLLHVLEESFGRPYDQVFAVIERRAMGAASMAQVHRALLQSGEEVIIKIQHANVATKMRADMCILPVLTAIMRLGAPGLVEGMRSVLIICHEMVKQELDMRIEGYNRERLAAIFDRSDFASRSRHARLVFPRVFWEYTSTRCMVQELARDAVTLNDAAAVRAAGVPMGLAVDAALNFFCESLFVHGYTHNDMHPGNILVRNTSPPGGRLRRRARDLLRGGVEAVSDQIFNGLLVALVLASLPVAVYASVALWVACYACAAVYVLWLYKWKREEAAFHYMFVKYEFGMKIRRHVTEGLARVGGVTFDLVVIDHGFHTHFPHAQRRGYCEWIVGTVLRDEAMLRRAEKSLGLKEGDWKGLPTLFSEATKYPMWTTGRMLSASPTTEEEEESARVDFKDYNNLWNVRMPKEYHLMNRAFGQLGNLCSAGFFGYGSEMILYRMKTTAAWALVGLDILDEDMSAFPVPGALKTADRAFINGRLAAARARVDRAIDWKPAPHISLKDWMKYKDCAKNFYPILEEVFSKADVLAERNELARCGSCDNCKQGDKHQCLYPKDTGLVDELYADAKEKKRKEALKKRKKKKKKDV